MSRSRRLVSIPSGYIPHNGQGCPYPEDEKPGVVYRIGTHIKPGITPASEYERYAQDPWTWDADFPEAGDIIAHCPEMVWIERLTIDPKEPERRAKK